MHGFIFCGRRGAVPPKKIFFWPVHNTLSWKSTVFALQEQCETHGVFWPVWEHSAPSPSLSPSRARPIGSHRWYCTLTRSMRSVHGYRGLTEYWHRLWSMVSSWLGTKRDSPTLSWHRRGSPLKWSWSSVCIHILGAEGERERERERERESGEGEKRERERKKKEKRGREKERKRGQERGRERNRKHTF